MAIEILSRIRLPIVPQEPEEVARLEDIGRALGVPGTYTAGTHFDGAGQPTFQEWLDANVSGREFRGPLTLDSHGWIRYGQVTISNVLMPGHTLYINTNAQLADNFTISGVFGAIQLDGNWGLMPPASNTMSFQNVVGSITINCHQAVTAFNNLSFFNCHDVRLDAGWDNELRINGVLLMQESSVILRGQGTAKHTYARTNIRACCKLEIHSNLAVDAVDLGPVVEPIDRHGFIIDNRAPERPLETYVRRENYVPSQPYPPDALFDIAGTWTYIPPLTGTYNLFAAGGGGGGSSSAGSPPQFAGGGSGAVARRLAHLTAGVPLTIWVGTGGGMHENGWESGVGAFVRADGGLTGDGFTPGLGGQNWTGDDGIAGADGSLTAGGAARVIYGSTLTGITSLTGSVGGAPTNGGTSGKVLITYVGG